MTLREVLDSSAVLAVLLGEPGAARVREVLAQAAVTTVNLAEIASYLVRNGMRPEQVPDTLDRLRFDVVAFGADLAFRAAAMVPVTSRASLSLGGRACLALAD